MTGWLLYDEEQYNRNTWFAEKLLEGWPDNLRVRLIVAERLTFGIEEGKYVFYYDKARIPGPDFVISRTIFPFLSEVLEKSGARVFNNSTTSYICNDKRRTYSVMCCEDIPTVTTYFHDRRFDNIDSNHEMAYPVIIKSACGHGGKEVFWAGDKQEKRQIITGLTTDMYVEQQVGMPYGQDLRVYVLGGKIIASVLRSSSDFKSNYSLGGSAELYELNPIQTDLVRRIIERVPAQMDFVGIDFLVCSGQLYFNEIEDVVGTRMLYSCTDLDPAGMYVDYITSKLC